ncbi:hypothetical protein BGW38_004218 [Lunasporangiospora selenospora]|uniref:OTU domain-containing protein n=1 Tax=Lunasporangiospora selenospora TaxID=979761 RepID=A0A9P6FRL3_9FUNG|nr:hypothetical protein BGW38_004218 [Lunasporangiospora selenospora]
MAPVKTRSTSSRYHAADRGYKADPEDTNDDDDFYGMRELKHQLAGLNLQLKDTMGDGNCLFRACADQFYGSEREHAPLRAEVCRYIEEHAEHFRSFLDNVSVEAHVAQMRKNGTYGGNIELVAFARMKKVDIKVYQPGYIYVIEGVDVKKDGSSPGQRPVMHIAYHTWEHYSSIRNIDGPHEGLPLINPQLTKQKPLTKLTSQDPPRSVERMIMNNTGTDDLARVRELMERYHGDVNKVYDELLEGLEEQDGEENESKTLSEPAAARVQTTSDKEDTSKEESSPAETPAQQERSNEKCNDSGEPTGAGTEKKATESEDSGDSLAKNTADSKDDRLVEDEVHGASLPTPAHTTSVPSSPAPMSKDDATSSPSSPSSSSLTPSSSPSSSPSPSPAPLTPTSLTQSSVPSSRSSTPLITAKARSGVDLEKPSKGVIPKKRMSSREKKELGKRNQKLNRKMKAKMNSATGETLMMDENEKGIGNHGKSGNVTGGGGEMSRMRELFV